MAPLIVIVGETASGKSAVAMELAEKFNGELICADSRTIYKGLDIGTAKPSPDEQAKVRHFGLDEVEPDGRFTVVDFKVLAETAIVNIRSRGKVPIIVGGTGLYVDSVLYDYQFQDTNRERDPVNPRHLLDNTAEDRAKTLRQGTVVVGLSIDREILKKRVAERIEKMFAGGLEKEVRGLAKLYGWQAEAMKGIGYREFQNYFTGDQTLDETKQLIQTATSQLAKRQRTWFKRNSSIQWFDDPCKLVDFVTTILNKNK